MFGFLKGYLSHAIVFMRNADFIHAAGFLYVRLDSNTATECARKYLESLRHLFGGLSLVSYTAVWITIPVFGIVWILKPQKCARAIICMFFAHGSQVSNYEYREMIGMFFGELYRAERISYTSVAI